MSRAASLFTHALALAWLAACSALSPQADPTRYFVLIPRADPTDATGPVTQTLGLGPVQVPDDLDEGIVTRLADEEIAISDTERWGEPLREALTGVIRQNLATLLGPEPIVVYPWRPSAAPDLAVAVEIVHFERTTHGTVEAAARWSIKRRSATTPIVTSSCSIRGSFRGNDTRAAVAALSVAVAELSGRIAADVRSVTPSS